VKRLTPALRAISYSGNHRDQAADAALRSREENMKAIFWTISILAGALFGLGSVVNQVAALF